MKRVLLITQNLSSSVREKNSSTVYVNTGIIGSKQDEKSHILSVRYDKFTEVYSLDLQRLETIVGFPLSRKGSPMKYKKPSC